MLYFWASVIQRVDYHFIINKIIDELDGLFLKAALNQQLYHTPQGFRDMKNVFYGIIIF